MKTTKCITKIKPIQTDFTHIEALSLIATMQNGMELPMYYSRDNGKLPRWRYTPLKRTNAFLKVETITHVHDNVFLIPYREFNFREWHVTINGDSNHKLLFKFIEAINRSKVKNPICTNQFEGGEPVQRRIVTACNQLTFNDGDGEEIKYLVIGARHYSPAMHPVVDLLEKQYGRRIKEVQGFIDQFDNFWNRKDALIIAASANQLNQYRLKHCSYNELYSEDLH